MKIDVVSHIVVLVGILVYILDLNAHIYKSVQYNVHIIGLMAK